MANELQRIISAFIQFLFVIILPYIWWFVTVRGKVPFMEWIGLKAVKRVKTLQLILWILVVFSCLLLFLFLSFL